MSKNINIYILFLIFSVSFSQDEFFYYDSKDKSAFLNEIVLDLNSFSEKNIDYSQYSIYLKIDDYKENYIKNVEWNINRLKLKKSNKYIEGFSGIAKNKFSKTIISNKENKTVLEIPLINEIEQDDELILKNIPIIFKDGDYCHKVIKISLAEKSTKNNNFENIEKWNSTNHQIIVSSNEIVLRKNYNFNDSNEDLKIDFSIMSNGISLFNKDRQYLLKLNDEIQWSENTGDLKLFYDEIQIDYADYILNVDDNNLYVKFLKNINSNKIVIENCYIKSTNTITESNLELLTELNSANTNEVFNNNKRFDKGLYYSSTATNKIYIDNLEIRLGVDNSGDFSIINNKIEKNKIPSINLKQNGKNIYLVNDAVLNIIIPDNVKLTWGNVPDNNSDYALTKLSDKNIRIKLEKDFNNESLNIDNLFFKKTSMSISPFQLQVKFSSDFFDNNEKIFCSDFISKGSLELEMKEQTIFTSEENPFIDLLSINYNKDLLLLPDDKIVIDMSSSDYLFFDKGQEIDSNQPENLSVEVYNQKIIINVINNLSSTEKSIKLKEIFFNSPNNSESDINIKSYVESGRYNDIRDEIELSNQFPSEFTVLDIHFDLSNTFEIVKNIYSDKDVYKLPDIVIQNKSSKPFEDLEYIKIRIPDFEYEFSNSVISALSSNSDQGGPECYIEKDNFDKKRQYITCEMYEGIGAKEIITIPNVKIEIDFLKNNTRLNIPLEMQIHTGEKDEPITTDSNAGLVYGQPFMNSLFDQSIFSDRTDFQALYQFSLDFRKTPNSIMKTDNLLIHIENKIDLEWGNRRNAYIVTKDNQLYKCPVSFNGNKKDIIIDITEIDKNKRERMTIGNLEFKNSGKKLDQFNLHLSIDDGLTWVAKDTRIKKIISESQSVEIIDKKIKEDIFPFNKGNQLIFIIDDEAPFTWDNSIVNDFNQIANEFFKGAGYSINSKTEMIGNPKIENNGKDLIFEILHDIYDFIPGTEPMDYRKKIGLKFPVVKDNKYQDDYTKENVLSLRIKTVYGDRLLPSRKSGFVSNKITFKQNEHKGIQWLNKNQEKIRCDIIMGEPDQGYKEDVQLQWYRYKTAFYKRVQKILNNDNYSDKDKTQSLKNNIKDIAKVFRYDKEKTYIKEDWLFWYNLAWYKYAWNNIVGTNQEFPLGDFGDYQQIDLKLSWQRCIDNALKSGYNDKDPTFPKPGDQPDPIADIINSKIIPDLIDKKYADIYNFLFDGLYVTKRLKNNGWEEIFCRYLFAFLSDVYFNDKEKIHQFTMSSYQIDIIDGIFRGEVEDIYKGYIKNTISEFPEIKEYFIDNPTKLDSYNENNDNFELLEVQYSNNYSELDCSIFDNDVSCTDNDCLWENNKCYDKCSIYNENECLMVDDCYWNESDIEGDYCIVSKDLGDVKIDFEWFDQDNPNIGKVESINNDWRVEVTPKDNKGLWLPYGYRTTTKRVPFYSKNPTKFEGSNFYSLKFDKLEKENDGLVTLGIGGGIILLLVLF